MIWQWIWRKDFWKLVDSFGLSWQKQHKRRIPRKKMTLHLISFDKLNNQPMRICPNATKVHKSRLKEVNNQILKMLLRRRKMFSQIQFSSYHYNQNNKNYFSMSPEFSSQILIKSANSFWSRCDWPGYSLNIGCTTKCVRSYKRIVWCFFVTTRKYKMSISLSLQRKNTFTN